MTSDEFGSFPENSDGSPGTPGSSFKGLEPIDRSDYHFSVSDVMSRSWDILRYDFFRIAGTLWTGIFLTMITAIIAFLLIPRGFPPGPEDFLFSMVPTLLAMIPLAGMHLYSNNLAGGQKARLSDLFLCRKILWTLFRANLLCSAIGTGVQLLLISPILLQGFDISPVFVTALLVLGVVVPYYVYLSISQFQFLIIEREAGPIQAMQLSYALMSGHRFTYFLLLGACSAVNFLGMIPFGIGLIITVPFSEICLAVFYKAVTGQPVADPFRLRHSAGSTPQDE